MAAKTAQAIRLHQFGGPDVLRLESVELPAPAAGQARVAIRTIGVNFVDTLARQGTLEGPARKLWVGEFPLGIGVEGAGIVEAVGPGVSGIAVGDRVAWAHCRGSYASHLIVPVEKLIALPDNVSFEEGAAVLHQGITAHYLSHLAYAVKPGDRCLVHAAAGGVGLLLCQMAKIRGGHVLGTVSSEEKGRVAKEYGADEIILYTQEDFETAVRRLTEGKGVSVVYDSVGKETFEKSLRSLAPRGYLVAYGQASGPPPPLNPQELADRGSLFLTMAVRMHYVGTRDEFLRSAGFVLRLLAERKLKLKIHDVLPLAKAADAHRILNGRQAIGKVLLAP